MQKINIDIETRSSVNLKTEGVYKYVEAPDFEILLFGYSIDGGPVHVLDLKNGRKLPASVQAALTDDQVEKIAFNAAFERLCIHRHFKLTSTPESLRAWRCSSVLAASYGLPGNLRLCAAALKLDVQKLRDGEALIRKFTIPAGKVVEFGGAEWETFKEYCAGDVVVEMAVAEALKHLPPLPDFEWFMYQLDQKINDRGVGVDLAFAQTCVDLDTANCEELAAEARELSGIDNPASDAQVKTYLAERLGRSIKSLNKKDVDDIDAGDDLEVVRLLDLRKELRKTSTSKFKTMLRTACGDGRLRGMFRFYGAQRTGRWSGKFVQLQNMPSEEFPGLDLARRGVASGDLELVRMTQDSVSATLSALTRSALVAGPGSSLACADYAAIEARIIAWLAGEQWRLDVFASHGKIYEASAAAMFGIPVEDVGPKSIHRKKGKVAELACGYGGGTQALINFGALKMGLAEEELQPIVTSWRHASPNIVALWKKVGNAALAAVRTGELKEVFPYGLRFVTRDQNGRKWLFIRLPSGRSLAYFDPILLPGTYGDEISYMKYGNDDGKSAGGSAGPVRVRTYGAKLVENIVQAIARDCLAVGLARVDAAGLPVIMHVHDEIITEVPTRQAPDALATMLALMSKPIPWAPGLQLGADGFTAPYYRK